MASNRVDKWILFGFLAPAFVLLAVFYIFPALWAVRVSFTDLALTGAKALNYNFVGFKEYQKLFSNPDFYNALVNTIIYTVGTCAGQFTIGIIAALLLSRKKLWGQTILMSAIILPLVVPSLIQALLWQNMLASGDFGTLNRIISFIGIQPVQWVRDYPMLSVILVNFWNNSGFAMILFLAGLENIPGEILESAQIDGASGWQTLRYIKLPLIRFVLLLWLLLNTLGCLNTFDLVYALTRGGPGTSTTIMGIFMYNEGFRYFELGLGSATAVVMLVISFIIAIVYVRLMRVEL
ncbi:MAG TPA: sugar ABC transporter permease [Phototrophicaceae bacterium]|nr:sugar ABC transporter permease [Phototrophicaceae bacterium]